MRAGLKQVERRSAYPRAASLAAARPHPPGPGCPRGSEVRADDPAVVRANMTQHRTAVARVPGGEQRITTAEKAGQRLRAMISQPPPLSGLTPGGLGLTGWSVVSRHR